MEWQDAASPLRPVDTGGGDAATSSSPSSSSVSTADRGVPRKLATATSSFHRYTNPSASLSAVAMGVTGPGIKRGPNAAAYMSSGIPDLDVILGGGFLLGSLVMIIEDTEAPHHLLLLRNFMAQGLVHRQSLLFASAIVEPRAFLGTLPSPMSSPSSPSDSGKGGGPASTELVGRPSTATTEGLRIAWQYKKYLGSPDVGLQHGSGDKMVYSNDFDLRKPLEKHLLVGEHIHCIRVQDYPNLAALSDKCYNFLSQVQRNNDGIQTAGRIAIQSLCAPQCGHSNQDWEMLSFIRCLKSFLRTSNAVAVLTFPASVLPPSFPERWKHLADTLLSVSAIPDEDKHLAQLLSGYQDMVGFLNVNKVAQLNTQVPVILEARTFSLKLRRRKSLVLEPLNQAPVDGSSRDFYETSGSCSGHSKTSPIDF